MDDDKGRAIHLFSTGQSGRAVSVWSNIESGRVDAGHCRYFRTADKILLAGFGGVYYESKCEQDIKITIMEFVDDYDHLTFSPPELIREGCVTVG